jgi:hypothetical protein
MASSLRVARGKVKMSSPGEHGGGFLWTFSSLLRVAIQKYRESNIDVNVVQV